MAEEKFKLQANASGYDLSGYSEKTQKVLGSTKYDEEIMRAVTRQPGDSDDDDDDDGCLLEDNPVPTKAVEPESRFEEVEEDDDDDGCMLEENPEEDDDDGCMLEENPCDTGGKATAEIDSDDDGCMLEDN